LWYDVSKLNLFKMKTIVLRPKDIFGKPIPKIIVLLFKAAIPDSGKTPTFIDVLNFVREHLEAIKENRSLLEKMDFFSIEYYQKIVLGNPEEITPDKTEELYETMEAAQDFLGRVLYRTFVSKREIFSSSKAA
jgi:hypothetical protein